MAEARLGVEPRPYVERAGYEVDTAVKVPQVSMSRAGVVLYIPHPRFLVRFAIKSLRHGYRKVQAACTPVPPSVILTIVGGVTTWAIRSPSNSWVRSGWISSILWRLDSANPLARNIPTVYRVGYLAFSFTSLSVLAVTLIQRTALRQLLGYHQWLFERRNKSLVTRAWGFVLKYVYIRRIHKNMFAYQGALPTLPLPELETTCKLFLESVEPLCTPEEFEETKKQTAEFLRNEGPKLQRYLKLKWWTSTNYISDWWKDLVYLRSRDSLLINSNWFGNLFADYTPTKNQANRAAGMVFNLVRICRQVQSETFEPQVMGGVVPLCMAQYDLAFSTTRIPGEEHDKLIQAEPYESRHVVVLHKGRFYKVPVFSPNSQRQLSPSQLAAAFEGIITSKDQADEKEALLPALTTMNRSEWARIREEHFLCHRSNRSQLAVLESALFIVSLDDEPGTSDWSEAGRRYLMGNGHNRWVDKSFHLVVATNGMVGIHVEHSWGDAPTLAHFMEICATSDERQEHFHPDGSIKFTAEDEAKKKRGQYQVFPAERIRFTVSTDLGQEAWKADRDAVARILDLDLHVAVFKTYGKGLVKKGKVSPDAWIQMALQVAYYRDQGHFDQSYEASMTRLFVEGRTETIRPVSKKSCAFVLALDNPAVPVDEKIKLLQAAADDHQHRSLLAMIGKGIDRHLFALYVVSVGKQIDSKFLKTALGRKWKLSTSQVATNQCPPGSHVADLEPYHSPNGGFGPVADDGYGVSYSIFGEGRFYFNISSKHSAKNTSSTRLHENVVKALMDMARLFDPNFGHETAPAARAA